MCSLSEGKSTVLAGHAGIDSQSQEVPAELDVLVPAGVEKGGVAAFVASVDLFRGEVRLKPFERRVGVFC